MITFMKIKLGKIYRMFVNCNQKVFDKLYWFGQYSFLCQIAKYYENNDLENVNREIYALRNFRLKYGKEI